ncbi:MAG: hypothetical protein O7C75_02330, partial [Verrucomicrobia bacterium]|nr:hypothetical protein [Verrucomicrobiota bacterium]
TGSPKLTIAHTLSNRPQPRHQEMLGLCLEVAPLAVNIEPGETFHTLRLKVMKRILEGMRHMQHIPWNHSDQPVYDVMFNYLNPHFGKFHGMDVEAEWLYPGHQETSLTLQVQEFREDDILRIAFDFRCDAVPAAEREPLISQFFEVLDNLLKDSGRNLIL